MCLSYPNRLSSTQHHYNGTSRLHGSKLLKVSAILYIRLPLYLKNPKFPAEIETYSSCGPRRPIPPHRRRSPSRISGIPRVQLERPDLVGLRTIRFLIDDDFPPLHFAGPDGNPTGFSVELARAACERLAITCTIQVRRFDMLLDALADRQGDVVAAAIATTASLARAVCRDGAVFQDPGAFRRPARPEAAASGGSLPGRARPSASSGAPPMRPLPRRSCQMATLKAFPELAAAQAALKAGEIDYLFADGLGLSLWLNGEESEGCCDFSGGALPGEPLLRRGHRLHRAQGRRNAAPGI